jgi:Ribbon-helix-helix protein, copG family
MEHVTVRLPSELAEELRAEGEAAGASMGWAIRRRLEQRRWLGAVRARRTKENGHHGGGGGKLASPTDSVE